MFLQVVAERRRPVIPDPPPAAPSAPQATFPPDGLTPASPAQIRAFFAK